MTSPSDRRKDIQEFLDDLPDNGGWEVVFLSASDFGERTGQANLFYIIKRDSVGKKGDKLHLKGLVPKVNIPFILALIAGDSIEQVAREERGTI
jgi:hypothetical protein